MDSTLDQTQVVRKNRTALVLTLLAFVIPFALAYAVHATGFWQNRGTVNNGQLVLPPINFDALNIQQGTGSFDRKTQWWIVYLAPSQCDAACKNSLFQMRQSQIATGPYKQKVSTLFISHEASDPFALSWAKDNGEKMQMAQIKKDVWNKQMSSAILEADQTPSDAGQIYIVDPMGAIFMTYPGEPDENASIQQGKGIVKDLKRVLKLSRIG